MDAGVITRDELDSILARQRREGGRVGEWVLGLELAAPGPVLRVIAEQLGIPYLVDDQLLSSGLTAEMFPDYPEALARRLRAIPHSLMGGTLCVAMSDPGDLAQLDAVAFALGRTVQPVLCTEVGLRRAIAQFYVRRDDRSRHH